MASAQSIGVFFDTGATDCDATIGGFAPATWYIIGLLGGASAGGITGAEFRQDGTPAGWFMTPTANPLANLTIGSPTAGGANSAFPDCQQGAGGLVLLYTVGGFAATAAVPETYLTIDRHTTPSSPDRQCASQILCDAPVFTQICVGAGQAIINGRPCTVGVEPTSWSKMKALYQN
jgi:hypothetical protein